MANIFKDGTLYGQIKAFADGLGIPEGFWVPIAQQESGGNTDSRALTAKEDSVGIFQLNRKGGQGTGYSVEYLSDPMNNAKIALPRIGDAYKAGYGKGYRGEDLFRYTLVNSGHPGKIDMYDPRLQPFVNKYNQGTTAGYEQTAPNTGSSVKEGVAQVANSLNPLSGVAESINNATTQFTSFGWTLAIIIVAVLAIFAGFKMVTA